MTSLEVVICTYNRAPDLDRCLKALSRQLPADAPWRVTVVDNNSTDHTAEVVAFHAQGGAIPNLVCIVETRQGLTPARQCGIRASRADWVAFVDDDCVVAPDWVAEALKFAAARPDAGAFGGRVNPDWGGAPAPFLQRHGWLFAEQMHGDVVRPVESLVGAGIVLNREALDAVGWTADPLLADRTGLGHVSGGDVEICFRLAAGGRQLWYVPSMHIDHCVAPGRQRLQAVLGLAHGLGAGAELVSLMIAREPAHWLPAAKARLRDDSWRHLALIPKVLRRRYAWRDWLIRAAYLSGQRRQHRVLRRDRLAHDRIAGACAG